jgi:hypothetical protein
MGFLINVRYRELLCMKIGAVFARYFEFTWNSGPSAWKVCEMWNCYEMPPIVQTNSGFYKMMCYREVLIWFMKGAVLFDLRKIARKVR